MKKYDFSHNYMTNVVGDDRRSLINVLKINKMMEYHQEIRRQINESIGIFPFLTIAGIFLNICLRVTIFVTVKIKSNYTFLISADFIILIFFNLLMIVILSLIPNEKDIFSEIILSIKKKTKSMAFYSFDQKTILFK